MAGIWKSLTLGVVAMAAVALVAGCGGATSGVAKPGAAAPTDPLAAALAAADTTKAAGSSRVAATMGYRTSGDPAGADSFTITTDGVYDFQRQIGEFEPPKGGGPTMGLTFGRSISARNVGYMEVPGQPGKWARTDYSKIVNTPIGAQDPAAQLELLKGIAAGGVREAGTETVRGDSTRHFAVTIDPEKLAANTSVVVPGGILETATKMLKPFPADVWIDGDGRVRRLTVKIEIAGGDVDLNAAGMGNLDPEMQARLKETMKDMRTSMDIGIEYFDFGVTVNTQEPSPSQVVEWSPLGPN
jgi:hypothetical protein